MESLNSEDILMLCNHLIQYSDLYYKFWLSGKPRFGDDVPTAAVYFNPEGKFVEYIINKAFWESLNDDQKCFVVSHEFQHILREHGRRFISKSCIEHQYANIAMDIVINHDLVNNYGFIRSTIDPDGNYCWIDTVFKDATNIEKNRTFEYYYNLMIDNPDNINNDIILVDDHSGYDSLTQGEIINGVGGANSDDILNIFKDSLSEEEIKEMNAQLGNSTNAGTGAGGLVRTMDEIKPIKKKKWESVIKNWAKKYYVEKDREISQWAFPHRRHSLLADNLMLPSDMEIDDHDEEKKKIDVFFFLDTSGSCSGLGPRFWKAANSLDPEKFELRLFCFDTRVYETTLESRKLYGFGGTSFDIISYKVDQIIKNHKDDYVVFVLTDGYGNNVYPKVPKKWHWFLTTSYKACIPKECNIHSLSNFE